MIVAIHQPEHLPWLGFFDKMRRADRFVLLDTVQFAKEDFQHRNRIKTRQGWAWLSVPVYTKGRADQAIAQVEICNDTNWSKKSWGLLQDSYRRSPHFEPHRTFFEQLYAARWTRLAELNRAIIDYLRPALGITTEVLAASELGVAERGGTNVVLAVCRAAGATTYLSGAHGRDYLEESQFDAAGIALRYQDFTHPSYDQPWGPFVPNLSAVDALFNHGVAARRLLDSG